MSTLTKKALELIIDGKRVRAQEGETVLEVAQREGINIPALCHLPGLPAWGACRLCLIEVEGVEKLQTACTTWATQDMVVKTDTPRVRARRQSYLKMYLSDHNSYCEAPCAHACPTHIDIPGFLAALAENNLSEAASIVREELPFPGILGRICPRYCESVCRRGEVDEPIAVCALHRALADHAAKIPGAPQSWLGRASQTGKKVAIVGAGPAGLSAAWFLAQRGHTVTIYDRRPEPGGALRYLIPEFRLPLRVLEEELEPLWQAGVRFFGGSNLGAPEAADELLATGFDAVIVATGAPDYSTEALAAAGAVASGIRGAGAAFQTGRAMAALTLLEQAKIGAAPRVEGPVVVLGEGVLALDAARTVLRLGATQAEILSKESRTAWATWDKDLADAQEEGVKLRTDTTVEGVSQDSEGKQQVEARGQDGSSFVLPASLVVFAAEPEISSLPSSAAKESTSLGLILKEANPFTGRTAREGLFACERARGTRIGDAGTSTEEDSTIHAVARGKRTALAVDAWLRGEDLPGLEQRLAAYSSLPYLAQLAQAKDLGALGRRLVERSPVWLKMGIAAAPAERVKMPKVSKAKRLAGLDVEVEKGLTLAAAQEEAKRCLQCVCRSSGKCELQKLAVEYDVTTNELVTKGARVRVVEPQYEHPFIRRDMEKCIACGRCVRVCRDVAGPACYEFTGRGFTIKVDTPYGEPLQLAKCITCGRCVSVCPTGALTFNERALVSFRVDESRCIMCRECVNVCPVEALAETDRFEEARQRWLELVAKGSRLATGHRMCAGCGAPVVVRQVLMAVKGPVVVGAATGCLEVSTTIYPYTSWKDSYIHTAFENVAATIAGVETAYRALRKKGVVTEDFHFIAFGGDGGTYDIGLQALSGAMERGHRMLYVCYDNGAYMNTGFQRSGATPPCAWTTTSPVGKAQAGKAQPRKNLTEIMIAHGLKYVAQASPHDPRDLVRKAAKALSVDGPSFLNVISPCPRGWRADGAESIELAREAVNTCYWPLFEYEDGVYRLTYRPRYKQPLVPWLKKQGRFAHLFQPGFEEALATLEKAVDEEWDRLLKKCGELSEAEWQAEQRARGCLLY